MRRISIEDYGLARWVFTTVFFVAGAELFQCACTFSFCFLLHYFSLCCNLFFPSWFFAFDFCRFDVQCFHGQIFLVVCHFFDDCSDL